MGTDLTKTPANSKIQGFGYSDKVEGTLNISSFSLGAGARRTFTKELTQNSADTTSLSRIKFSGIDNTKVNNTWIMIFGALEIRCSSPNYDIACVINRTEGTQTFTVQFHNSTGASLTVPSITVDFVSYYYTAPW